MTVRLHLDALSPSIGDQLRDQGLRLDADRLTVAERRRTAVTDLLWSDLVTPEEARAIRERLTGWIAARVVEVGS